MDNLGIAGTITALVGFGFLLLVSLGSLVSGRDVLDLVSSLGFLIALVGLVLLGAATLRAGVLPLWCGVLLILVLPLSPVLGAIAGVGGILPGIVVWAMVGYALLSYGQASAQQPSRVS